ncbi:gluconokinase [Humidisolicoccus flavus]|uniref:gluconokinase n=1 Tax=Humidisolicoccus flavus TaxID=3111414 RepID=UPI00324D25D0
MSPVEHLVVMGVSGAGKTTIAQGIAHALGRPFAEADEFHPEANVQKMSAGISLSSEDRMPWLDSIRIWMDEQGAKGLSTVVACSALREVYRERLNAAQGSVRYVHLTGDREMIRERMARRNGHFMPASLIDSQFDALEPLGPHEHGVSVGVEGTQAEIIENALAAIRS